MALCHAICNLGPIEPTNLSKEKYQMAEPVHVTDDSFQAEVLESDVPVVVDFWAEWCGPCRYIAPIIKELAVEYEGKAKMAKVDVDHNQMVAGSLGIRSIPTLLFFKGGERVDMVIGSVPKKIITDKLDSLLS